MPEIEGLFGLAVLALWAYCIFDVIRTPEGTTENLPKMLWLLIVIFLPTIGSLAWLLLGRPRHATFQLRTNTSTSAPQLPGPNAGFPAPRVETDKEYQLRREEALRKYNEAREDELRKREEDLHRREEELRKREQGETETP